MIINFYYKEPDAATEAVGPVIREKYPNIKPYSKAYWNKCREFVKSLTNDFGKLASGDEDLRITVVTNNPGSINVNGSIYRLVTQEETK
jgi:hypothetical protein